MTLPSEKDIRQLIADGAKLTDLVHTTGLTYPALVEIQNKLEDDLISGQELVTDEYLEPIKPTTGMLVDDIVASEHLDNKMHDLASSVIDKLEVLTLTSTEAHQISNVVESLAKLREAFYGKEPYIQVNNQTNITNKESGEAGGPSILQGLLRR